MLGENFESFEQWKCLIVLLSGCRAALTDARLKDLYFRLVPVLYAQIEQLPEEFFATDPELAGKNNFVGKSMHDLITTALEPEVSPAIRKRLLKLQGLLVRKFGFKPVQSEQERVIQKFQKLQTSGNIH